MKIKHSKHNLQKGYAILFTVVIISVISVIAIGLSNSTYKQLILSSIAKDSQVAFYESDMATECALYADFAGSGLPAIGDSYECGVDSAGSIFRLKVESPVANSYTFTPDVPTDSTDPCFEISINKTPASDPAEAPATTIIARGYNNCDKDDPRTVEREIEVTY